MRFATATLCLLTSLTLTDRPLSAFAQERTSSIAADAPVAAPKPGGPDAGHPPLIRTDSELRIFADEQNIHTTAAIRYTPLRGAIDHVRFAVPGSERLLAVTLDGSTPPHETAVDGDFTTVTIDLPSRVGHSVSLEIHTQRSHSGTRLDLGGESEDQFIRPLDVLQSHGIILLACDPALDMLIEETRGLAETAPPPLRNASAEARSRCFQFYGPRLRLQAALRPAHPQKRVHQDARYSLRDGELLLHSALTYEATGTGVFDLSLELPEAFVLEDVRVDGQPTTHRTDGRILALSFKRALRKVQIAVRGRSLWQSALEQPLPSLRALHAASSTGTIAVAAPAGFDVELSGDGLSRLRAEGLTPPSTPPENTSTRAWQYHTPPGPIQVHLARAQPRVSAHLDTEVRIRAGHAALSTLLEYDVRQSGTRLFRFALPEHAGAVQIDELDGAARILERTQVEADHPRWTAWTLRMNRDVLGPQQFRVSWSVPLQHVRRGAEGESAGRLTLSPPRVLPPPREPAAALDQASGQIALHADPAFAVSLRTATGGLKRAAAADNRIVFHHDNSPVALEIDVSPAAPVAASTLVSRALIEIRPVPDGPADYECRYRLQSGPRRLPIQLPAGSEPLTILFGSVPVPLLRAPGDSASGDFDRYEIDLSQIELSAAQRLLFVRFRTPLDDAILTRPRGSFTAPLPLLGELDGRSVAIAETRTCLSLPAHLAVIGTPRGFALAARELDHRRWIEELPTGTSPGPGAAHVFQSHGRPEAISIDCWDRIFATWLLSGAAFLIALVLRPTAGENRLTMLLMGAVVLALLSLMHPHAVAQGLLAARWGLAAAAILWTASAAKARTSRTETSSGAIGSVAAVISPPSSAESRPAQFRRGA